MAQQNKTTLKTYFNTGDKPTEAQFADLVDSSINPSDNNSDDLGEGTTNLYLTAAERAKLGGIEASADVTDAANVTAAGALMDSELTSEADVKALDQSVVSGASPTFGTANFTDATDKRLMTDAQEAVVNNTSGTNTGDQDLSGLALKSNVLELDNTDVFTPSADYEPSTKKYVDDKDLGGFTEITAAAFKTAVTGATLVANSWYKVTGATSSSIDFMVYALTTSTWRPQVMVLNDDFDWAWMEIDAGVLIVWGIDRVECVVRNTGGTWGLITTGGHQPYRVSSVANQGTSECRITYTRTDYTHVISSSADVDEAYGAIGAYATTSKGLTYADVAMYRNDRHDLYLRWSGSAWQTFGDTTEFTVGTYSSGSLPLTHEDCNLYMAQVSGGADQYAYEPKINGNVAGTTTITWKDGGTQYTGAEVINQRCYLTRIIKGDYLNTDSDVANSNFWYMGTMAKKMS